MNPRTLMLDASLICPVLLAAAASAAVPLQDPGPTVRWEVDSASENWLGTSVALGDHGAALIAGKELNTPSVTIYSTASPLPIHELELPDTWQVRVDAAREAQTMAAMVIHQDTSASSFTCWAELKVWTEAKQAGPDWVYRFPLANRYMSNGMDVHVSDDGQVIAAWFTDLGQNVVHLKVFNPTGDMLLDHEISRAFNAVLGDSGDLSDDGSRLLIDIGNNPALIDLATGDELLNLTHHSMFGGLALSGDGRRMALGGEPFAEVWEENASGDWSLLKRMDFTGERIAGAMELDTDGSHIAMTVMDYTDWFQVRVRDLNADREVYRHKFEAPGNNSNLWPSKICLTDDAQLVAGSSWGDSFDTTPTGFVFDANGALISTLRTTGSGLAFDMDPSGQVMAMSTKRSHVNEFGSGGQIICADTRQPELSIAGYPESAGKIAMTIRGAASHVRVVAALELGASPTAWGPSQLDLRSAIANSGFQAIPATGLQRQLTLPSTLALIGQALHVQAELVDRSNQVGYLSNRVSIRVLP
jgi:hypothetical protein